MHVGAGARVLTSTAAERERARAWRTAFEQRRILPLAATTFVTLAGLLLAYQAKTASFADTRAALVSGEVLDLREAPTAVQLEPALARLVRDPAERRLTAQRVADALAVQRAEGSAPQNVGILRSFFTPEQLQAVKPRFVVRDPGAFRRSFLLHALLYFAAFAIAHAGLHVRGRRGDRLLLPVAQLLTGLGLVALLSLRDPLRDQLLFARFTEGAFLGALAMVGASLVVYEKSVLRRLAFVPLGLALLLSVALVAFGSGPGESDAKVNLWGAQPIELIRLLIVLFLAGYFASRWSFLRELDERPLGKSWMLSRLRLPRLDHVLPVLGGVVAGLLFFFLQKDLGPALILLCLFLALYAVSRRHAALGIAGLLLIVAAFSISASIGYPRTVRLRTAMWMSPWENGLARGDQLAHSLWAFAAGGATGTGLGLGAPAVVPAAHTDLVLAAIGEELGFCGFAAALGLYALLIARGFRIARRAPEDYTTFLALGITLSFGFQILLILGGILGLAPLAGVVTPFMSYGRSALILHCAGLGILWSISASGASAASVVTAGGGARRLVSTSHSAASRRGDPFARPMLWLTGIFGVLAVAVLAKAGWVQLARGDELLARNSLVQQADGQYRYQSNPRLRQVGASIPRGNILDRNGVVLATSDWDELERHRADYERLGIDLARATSPEDERHYPFGGLTYHLLGDLTTRRNWGASNTSYVERDSDATLRGFEDHARMVTIEDPKTSEPRQVQQRDLSELVPLWRHRQQPNHPAVRAILDRPRDVKLALDVRLQARAARALAERLEQSNLERGAIVVLEPETGDLLAATSAPAPTHDDPLDAADDDPALLDRARYGLYPPGSTFKLVTAAAALTKDPRLAEARFPCRMLPGGRAGVIVNGRPVRDDRADTPHGDIAMEQGTIVSCNAYYAQLGTRVGWSALETMASAFEIPIGEPATAAEQRAHVVEAAYGQGHVLASPFKMARVAATIAANGQMANGRWVVTPPDERSDPPHGVMEPTTARKLARYMRGVVEHGTGRRLATSSPAIAGKTGTAEVATGPSHAWFVGYAPYGSKQQRIAFAVLLENGGYGGAGATEVAGEVVRAATELGLIE